MLHNRKKLFASLLLLLSLGIIGWFVLFEYGVRRLENSLDMFATNLREKGYTFSYSDVQITGNPLSIKAVFQNPHIKDPKGFFEWEGLEATLSMHPWNIYRLTYSSPGNNKLTVPQNLPIPLGVLQVKDAKGYLTLTLQGNLDEINLKADRVYSILMSHPQPPFLEETSLDLKNLSDSLNLKLSFKTNLRNIEKILKIEPLDHPFTIELEARLSGFLTNKPFPKTLAEWRDGGGVVEVSHISFTWPPVIAEGEGTLTLDKDMYPLGSFSSRVVAYQEALTYLVQLGLIKRKNASAASFVLELFSQPDENGKKHLKVPITLQNKKFSVGPAPLFKLLPVE